MAYGAPERPLLVSGVAPTFERTRGRANVQPASVPLCRPFRLQQHPVGMDSRWTVAGCLRQKLVGGECPDRHSGRRLRADQPADLCGLRRALCEAHSKTAVGG